MTETRADVYSRITDQIAAAIEEGATDWRMPWHHDGNSTSRPINLASNKPYRGVNVLALWITADASGYTNGLWGTYRQWLAEGAQVRKGERGTTVVLWKQSTSGSMTIMGVTKNGPVAACCRDSAGRGGLKAAIWTSAWGHDGSHARFRIVDDAGLGASHRTASLPLAPRVSRPGWQKRTGGDTGVRKRNPRVAHHVSQLLARRSRPDR